ncbi:PAS domain S-box protein [Conexibacter sp. CPCC 206217]|uniref:sensor histidine kinase n=1 Tax=Conexibacter sp. CPCC 206217 TaxID=3064574 RepID=UPI00271ED33A|nr:PAS domain S-box protein [Conexibacter sp. CPCC 206217]MDO8213321.1 PAS domain S-box protein [Conexibacter sp. CPCC 206217]
MTADQLAALLQLAPDPTIVLDRHGLVAVADERAAELAGGGASDLVGARFDALIPQGVLDPDARLTLKRTDGREFPVEISVRVIDGIEGVDGPALAVALRDVTLRRARATGLREAGERFRRLFEDGPVAMALIGEDRRLAEVNDAYARLTGYDAAELRERTFSDITHPDDVDSGERLVARMFAGEIPGFGIDKRYVRRNGETLWVHVTVSLIRDEDGAPLQGLGVIQKASERAARARMQAAEAERARWARELHDETLQGLAALHVLLSSGERAPTPELMRARIALAQEQIEGTMDNLRGLINDLRPAALDELGLEASVRDLADRMQTAYGIEVDTTVALHGDDGAPRRLASEVETTAYRIVQECLSNAARHAGATRIGVEITQVEPPPAGSPSSDSEDPPAAGVLHVRVRDDGSGFDATSDAGGYGLRSIRERVDLLEGDLTITTAAGDGTEVVAALPLGG